MECQSKPPQVDAKAFKWMANNPEMVWQIQADNDPQLMRKVETMLASGVRPEWILHREGFSELPVEVQTVFLNALHWRQNELRKQPFHPLSPIGK